MPRALSTFVGIDLGGTRGKTTAVARLALNSGDDGDDGNGGVAVLEVMARYRGAGGETPWTDAAILNYLDGLAAKNAGEVAVAIDAPLTVPACVRCQVERCPGVAECVDVATVWLRTEGVALHQRAAVADRDRVAATAPVMGFRTSGPSLCPSKQPVSPYSHRCTEIHLHYSDDVLPRDALGRGTGRIAARARHLRKQLAGRGYTLNENLIEVSPRATVHSLFGPRKARGYKRDADPWQTRAAIVEGMGDTLRFALSSRLSREEVLRNDHCFDALLSAYTAFLWARDDWQLPDGEPFATDGWIWAPPGD